MSSARIIAIFDFDNTLIKGDSLWPFLVAVAGWPRCVMILMQAMILLLLRRNNFDKRTFIKEYILLHLLGGRRLSDLSVAIEKIKTWKKELKTADELRKHHAAGHHIVIATGSLNLYMPAMLEGIPYDVLICTDMEISDNIVTGKMTSGNCVRMRKAEFIKKYLNEHGPFDESWGYGNTPHDVPMLNLVKHRVIV